MQSTDILVWFPLQAFYFILQCKEVFLFLKKSENNTVKLRA